MGAVTTTLLATAAVVGGGLAAFGQIEQGQEARESAEYNARISEQEAGLIRQKNALNEYQQRKALKLSIGQQVAGFAGAGVELTGSPLAVMVDSIANAELVIAIDRFNLESGAKLKESEAYELRRFGKATQRASYISAASTLLETGATAYSSFSATTPKKKIGN